MKLLIHIAYLGTNYCGYQVQSNAPSIQKMLNCATEELFGYPCDLVGCSRTDSGVHAHVFCATVAKHGSNDLPTDLHPDRIVQALCAHLPEDIRVFAAEWVPSEFHARYDVLEKEYLYRIYNHPVMDPFELNRAWHFPQKIDAEGIFKMQKAASFLLGAHDFSAFMAQGSRVESTVRTIRKSTVEMENHLILYRVAADGFLYNMVRIIVGTLVDVGRGKLQPEDLPAILESKERTRAGQTAPACGLYLDRVSYPNKNISGYKHS